MYENFIVHEMKSGFRTNYSIENFLLAIILLTSYNNRLMTLL